MSDPLERALFDLGDRVAYPATPRFEIPTDQGTRRRARSWRWPAAAVVAGALLVLVALPGPRAALANLLGVGSVSLTVVDEMPAVPQAKPLAGAEVSLAQAQEAVDFPILTLDVEPDAVILDRRVAGGTVSLVYGRSGSSARLIITQLQAETDLPAMEKAIAGGTEVSLIAVGGEDGLWIEGDPHPVILLDRAGKQIRDSARLAGNTLLFTRDGLTIRIEGDLDLDRALEIAAGL